MTVPKIDVCLFTSAIPCHPDTSLISDVIDAIQWHLPESKIHILCDGIRPSVEHRRIQYGEYKQRLQEKYSSNELFTITEWEENQQQVAMARFALNNLVKSELAFLIEHDIRLYKKPIDWANAASTLRRGRADMIRFYWMDTTHPEHEHLMCGDVNMDGVRYQKSLQFSGWNNLARAAYWKWILEKFDDGTPRMIEGILYGPVAGSKWDDYRQLIYYPEEGATFFKHENGRQGLDGLSDEKEW